jgi:hypothetical protein
MMLVSVIYIQNDKPHSNPALAKGNNTSRLRQLKVLNSCGNWPPGEGERSN